MSKIFSTQFHKGSYIDAVSKTVGVSVSTPFRRTERGLAPEFNGSNSKITYSNIVLSGDWSIVVNSKYRSAVSHRYLLANVGGTGYLSIRDIDRIYMAFSTTTINEVWTRNELNNQLVVSKIGVNVYFYINNILLGSSALGSSAETFTFNTLGTTASSFLGTIYKAEAFNNVLSSQQRQDLYESFLNSSPVLSNKFPKYGTDTKSPNDNNADVLAHFNFVSQGTVFTDISNSGHDITINKATPTFDGAKLADHETIGNLGNVKSIAFRIKLDSTTEKILEGDPNEHLIHASAGTLTYPDFDNAFIDGVDTNTVVADQWHNIMIVSSTNVNMTDVELALNDTTNGNYEIEDLIFYSTEKTLQDGENYHNSFAKRVVLIDDFILDPVSDNLPLGWTKNSGTFSTKEDTTSKYISCDGDGTISFRGIDLSSNFENGWIKQLDGDLSGDAGDTVDNATNVAFANNTITLIMTTGQKVRNLVIQQAEEQ